MTDDNPHHDPQNAAPPVGLPEPPLNNIFIGPHGIRAGWRLLIYIILLAAANAIVSTILISSFGGPRGTPGPLFLMTQEVIGFAAVFAVACIMAVIEHRTVGEYGLPARCAFGKNFWLGFLFGLAEIAALIGLISAFGGYSFGSLALQGNGIFKWGLFYLLLFTFVGLFEEFLFRGYGQYTLGDGIGFWPAALLLSLIFGGVHLRNPGEGWVGAAGVVTVALLFCFSLKRTGNLWYAVGLHAAFDWGETYLFSVPNSGLVLPGHLSHAILHGPSWLTGGTVGPEGSIFCFLTLGLQFLVIHWLFPAKKREEVAASDVAV
jgi:uncharacterized protein